MDIHISPDKETLGQEAGAAAVSALKQIIAEKGHANIIVATGASQFDTLKAFTAATDIDWASVTAFHLDEYIGMDNKHPASFVKYLQERFADKVPLKKMNFVRGDTADPAAETERLDQLISAVEIDLALIGIGENAHIAFNDPPADFETEKPYLVVNLDEACRKQQLGEGWFPSLADVPSQAISMSVRQILKSKTLIVSVPDERKAQAVADSIHGPLTNTCPASILREHNDCHLYVDEAAASLLKQTT